MTSVTFYDTILKTRVHIARGVLNRRTGLMMRNPKQLIVTLFIPLERFRYAC